MRKWVLISRISLTYRKNSHKSVLFFAAYKTKVGSAKVKFNNTHKICPRFADISLVAQFIKVRNPEMFNRCEEFRVFFYPPSSSCWAQAVACRWWYWRLLECIRPITFQLYSRKGARSITLISSRRVPSASNRSLTLGRTTTTTAQKTQ